MARIRSIKPEFPQSETIGKLSREARLLFIQLWTIVDDDGRARAASRMLASLLYPYDDDARALMDGWLSELEHTECIKLYEVEGSSYLEIVKWLKHQKIDHASKSRLPACPEGFAKPREASRSLAPDLGPRTMDQDLGSKEVVAPLALAPAPTKRGRKPSSKVPLPDDWTPNEAALAEFGVEACAREGPKIRDWARAKAATMADWDAFFRNWMRKNSSGGFGGQYRENSSGSGTSRQGKTFAERAVEGARRAAAVFESSR